MRILIISRSPWRLDNSFGNTYSSIFRDMKDVEIANIYLADGEPEYEPNVKAYYKVSEKALVNGLRHPFRKSSQVGEIVFVGAPSTAIADSEYDNYLSVGKKKRWPIMFLMREMVWKFGNVNMDGVTKFAKDFNPDIIFLPYYYAVYVFRIALYLKKVLNVPMTGEACLDIYSLKQLSFDPVFWLNRFYIRKWIRKAARASASLYTISEKMKVDYSKYLNIESKILYKIPDFSRKQFDYTSVNQPVHFLFTGNIGANRWKTLSLLVAALKANSWGHLDIYTNTPLTPEMKNTLEVEMYSQIHPPVSQSEVKILQNNADILVHAESFDLANKLLVRYSISTKIMDYLCMGRAILGIGPKDIASIEYLKDNDAAMVVTNIGEMNDLILQLKNNESLIMEYSHKGLDFAKTQMNAEEMKVSLYNDMKSIIEDYSKQKDPKRGLVIK